MGLGILWSAENWLRKEQPWRVASGTRAVSREGPKKSWRQKVWRASRKNCNFTHSPPHTLELNHCRLVSGFCQYLSVCVSVGLRYSSGSGDTPEEAKKRPRLKAHKGKCRLGVITGSLFYKFCLLLEAPWDLFQSRCLSTWFGLSSMLFHYIWGIFFFFFSFFLGRESRTQRTFTESFHQRILETSDSGKIHGTIDTITSTQNSTISKAPLHWLHH